MKELSLKRFYRNPIAYACAVLIVLSLSCSQEDEVSIPKPANYEKQIQFLTQAGFNEKDIVFNKGTFIIEEDILLTAEEVDAYMELINDVPEGRTDHYRGSFLVSDTYVTNVKFFISSTVPAAWATAVRDAITQWNAVNGTKLFLSEVATSGEANTIINTAYADENWVARAYLPSSRRRPGHQLTINTRFNSLSSGRKLFTMVHEMGHIIGLYHTNQTQGIFIQGTPTTDPNSVMNSFVLPWNGFTQGDIAAVTIIYPE
jgi:hypothetical protein